MTTPPYSHIALWSCGFPVVSLAVCLDRWPLCWSGWCISTDTAGKIGSGETSAAASSVPSCYTLWCSENITCPVIQQQPHKKIHFISHTENSKKVTCDSLKCTWRFLMQVHLNYCRLLIWHQELISGRPPDILMGHGPIYMYDVIIITQHNFAEASLADFKIWL